MAPRCAFGEGCSRQILYKPDVDPLVSRASKYCEKHTCFGVVGEDPCFKKVVKTGETRCITHVQCEAMFCDEPRLPAANGGWWACCSIRKFILTWLLDKCKEESCMNLREYHNSKEKYFKYCLKHKCIKPECENVKAGGSKQQCKTHTCTQNACTNVVVDEEKLCTLHLQCGDMSCTRKRALRKGQYQKYCPQHIICEVIYCEAEKRDNSQFCANHTCPMRDCTQSSGVEFYCSDHTCEVHDCNNARVYYFGNSNASIPTKSSFCPIHECRKDDCHRLSRNNTFGYCREHNCDRVGCNNLKLIDPGSNPPLLLCRKHYDESRNPPPNEITKTPSPAPAPAPQKLDTDLERKLSDLRREQREHGDKLDDILRILDRRR